MAMLKSCSKCGKIHAYNERCNVGKIYKKNKTDNLRSKYAWTKKSEEIKKASNYLCAICLQEGIYNYDDVLCKEFHDIYVPLLVSVLRSNRIKCETVDFKGLARKYNIKAKPFLT